MSLSGRPINVVATYPEFSVQHVVGGPWWESSADRSICRGRLAWTMVPFPDMKPYRLEPQARGDDARQHSQAAFTLQEFRLSDPPAPRSPLPVAGLPTRPGESHIVRRGKVRLAIVLGLPGTSVTSTLRAGGSRWQYSQALIAAPYYSVEADGGRGGWNPAFVERVRRAEYSQYHWDALPFEGSSPEGSVLRLDHLFPVGADPANWRLTQFRLTPDALAVLLEWVNWHLGGALHPESALSCARELLLAEETP